MNNYEKKFKKFLKEGIEEKRKERPSIAFSDKHYDKEGGDKLRKAADNHKEKMRKLGKVDETNQIKEDYNGWQNYATWRLALEVFDGMDEEQVREFADRDAVKEYTEEIIETSPELAQSYAMAFLNDVNYQEILDNMRDNHDIGDEEE